MKWNKKFKCEVAKQLDDLIISFRLPKSKFKWGDKIEGEIIIKKVKP